MKIWDHCSKVSVRARVMDLQIRAKDELMTLSKKRNLRRKNREIKGRIFKSKFSAVD